MKSSFALKLIIAGIVLVAIALILQSVLHKEVPMLVWFLIPLYALVTWLLYYMIGSASKKSPHRFVAAVNGAVIIKLFLTAGIVAAYLFLGYPGKKALALSVMGIYLVNTAVLIWALIPALRGKNN
jgi:hypothetical protein